MASLRAAPGDLDASFVPPFILSQVRAALPLADGKVLVVGSMTTSQGVTRSVARLNSDGTLDAGFTAPVFNGDAWAAVVLPSGQIIIGGTFTTVGGVTRNNIARLNANGTLDAGFTPNISGSGVYALGPQADGKIVVGGDFTAVGGVSRTRVARLNANGTLDTSFTASANGSVGCLLVQRDGRIILGGSFTSINGTTRHSLARVGATGTLESSFNPDVRTTLSSGLVAEVMSVAETADGKILIGGQFERVGAVTRINMARLQSDGTLDTSSPVFNPAPNGPLAGLCAQADGKVLAAGEFATISGGSRNRLARLTATGTLDTTHVANVGSTPLNLAQQTNGRTLVSGMFTSVSGTTRSRVARLDNDAASQTLAATEATRIQWLRGGTLPEAHWVTFESSTDNGTTWTPLGAGTRIIGGWELTGVGLPAAGMIRGRACLSASGKSVYFQEATHTYTQLPGPEISIEGPSAQDVANEATIDLGTVPVGGQASVTFTIRNQGTLPLTASSPALLGAVSDNDYTLTTAPVFPVAPGGSTTFTVRFTPVGTGLRNGAFYLSNNDGDESYFVINFTAIGSGPGLLDQVFSSPFTNAGGVGAIAAQPDGKVLYGGTFLAGSNPAHVNLIRVNPNGTLDAGFYAAPNDNVTCIAVLPDRKILVGGYFTDINGTPRTSLARLNPDGSLDAGFAPVFNANVNCLVVQGDGRVIVGGNFTQVNGTARARLARLNTDGTVDPLFNPGADGEVLCLYYREGDERVFVGGNFATVGGAPRDYLASVWLDGAIDMTFTPDVDGGPVHSILLAPGGGPVIGGMFSLVDGQNRGHIARLTGAGRLDTSFSLVNAANRAPVWGLAGQMNGKLLLTGYFFEIASQWRNGLARLNANGTLDTAFNPEPWEAAVAAALQQDGKVLLSGGFTTVGALPRIGVARVLNEPATNTLTVVGPNQIQWAMGGSFPVPSSVIFEVSTDGQNTWQPLGIGRPISPAQNGWESVNVILPVGGHVRARARVHGGLNGASSGLIEAVTAFGVPPEPEITLESGAQANLEQGSTLNLGVAPSTGGVPALVRIRNTGPAPLTISQLLLAGTDFANFSLVSPPATPFTLTAGASVEFDVLFSPTTAGAKAATLTILSNDADEAAFVLNLAGQALAPSITTGVDGATVDVGQELTLNVAATGSTPLGYQWYIGTPGDTSQPVGGNSPTLGTGPLSQTTSFWVRVSNPFGHADSSATVSVNFPPTITALADITINEDASTAALPFAIGDSQTAAGSLVVSSASDNPALVPSAGIVLGGSGASRQLTVTPLPDRSGQANITVTVSDGRLASTSSFLLTVQPVNDAPTISPLANRQLAMNTTSDPVGFSIVDVDHDPAALIVTATSSNQSLVAAQGIAIGGSGGSRHLTISPVANQFGTTTITVTVSDGSLSATTNFVLTVFPPNYPPTISAVAAQATNEDTPTAPIAIIVGDVETAAEALVLSATSDNPSLVAPAGIAFGGSGANRTLVVTPSPNQHGTALVSVTVSDGEITASRSFTLTVDPVNDAPTISNITDKTATEGTPTAAIPFTLGDIDTNVADLTVTATSGNTTLVPNANIAVSGSGASRQLVITPAALQNGSAVITVTVSDGTLTASDTFTLTVTPVNDPPTIADILDRSTAEDTPTTPIAITVGDIDNPAGSLTLSASSGNTSLVAAGGFAFSGTGANRTLVVTPQPNQHGTAVITVTVSDGQLTASKNFTLTVTPVNDAPTISNITDKTATEGTATAAIPFTLGDIDTNVADLTVTTSSGNTTLVPNANIVLSGTGANRQLVITPAPLQNGTAVITVSVSDGTLTATDTFTLTVTPVNDPPTIADIADQATAEDTPTAPIAITVGDIDNPVGSLTLSAISGNTSLVAAGGFAFSGTGANRTLVVTPLPNQHGTAVITVTVSDGQLTASKNFTLTVTPVNDAPTISNITDKSTAEGTATAAIPFTIGDIDTDLANLTVTASSGNTTLVPNANIALSGTGASRQLVITPAPLQNGSAVITVTVSDGALTASDTFTLTVTPVNDPPTIANIADQATAEDTPTAPIAITVGDIDNPVGSLTLLASSGNTSLVAAGGFAFSGTGANRTLVVTPQPNQHGTAVITVTVSDGQLTASKTFTLTVTPVNDAPTISNITDKSTSEGTATTPIPFTIGDIDTDLANLTVTASSSDTTLVPNASIALSGTGASRQLVITPASLQNGTAVITVTVSDGALTASDTFTLTVTPVNDPPTIESIADQTSAEDTPTAPIAITVGDIDNPAGSLTLSASSGNTSLVASGGFAFGGSGANRTLVVTPLPNQHGTAVITVTVSDGQLTASKTFTLTATPVNDAPTIGSIGNQSTTRGAATPTIAFVVGDVDNDPATLTLSGASSNAGLLPGSGIVFTGSGANRGVTATPASDQIGSVSVTVTVSDGALSASRSFALDVSVPKPVITSPATSTGRRNDPFQYLITATDAPTSFAATGLPAGLTLNPSTGQITGAPTVHGSFTVTLLATNSSGTGQRVITLTIDPPIPPPVVLNPTILAGNVNVPISFQASATNTPQTYELLNAPAWLSVSASGLITGTPSATGTFNFKIRASNQSGPGASTDVALTVEPHPQAPSITSIVQVRGRQSVAFSHALTADPAATSFALVSGTLPPGVNFIPASGSFSGTPTAAGTYNLTLSAANAFGTGRAAPLRIIIDPPPQVPVISSTASLSGSVGVAFSTTVTASFSPTSFTFSNLPAWLTQNGATGQVSGTPPSAGTFNIDVFATNGDGAGPVQRLVLTVAHHPNAPRIQLAGDFTAFQGLPFNATILTSPAATALTATGLPPGITVNSAARTLGGTPLQPGEHEVTLQASNASGTGPAVSARFVVRPTPGGPEITSSLAEFPLGLQPFTYQIQARSEIPVLGYAATGLPAGLSLNATTGVISGTPQVLGTFEVKLSARNAVGSGAESTLVLTVRPGPNVPKVTSAASASGVVGQTLAYQITADNNPTAYAADGLPEGLVLDSLTGAITGTPVNPGTYDFKVSAANLNGSGPAQMVKISVTSPLGAPILVVPAYIYFYANQPFVWQLEASGMPSDKPWPSGTGIYAESLPPGMSLNSATGVLSGASSFGIFAGWARFAIDVYAVANGLRGRTERITLEAYQGLGARPIITGPKSLSVRSGSDLSFTISADRPCSAWNFNVFSGRYPSHLLQYTPSYLIYSGNLPRPGSWTYGVSGFSPSEDWGVLSGLPIRVDPAVGAPVITTSEAIVGRAGTALSGSITASASPTQFEADFAGNAPSGVGFNATTGQFSGTPTTPGNFSFLARARNASGWSLPKFTTLAILPAATQQPQSMSVRAFGLRRSSSSTTYRVGEEMTYTPSVPFAANYFTMTGLPPGLAYNETTGEISGTPETPGVFTVKLRPFSDTIIGEEIEVPFTILPVEGAPEIAADIVIEGTAGEELAHTMAATESPLGFNFSDLPDFVIVDPLTGEVSGTPHTPGTYEMVVSAFNALGEGMPVVVRFEIAPADGTPVTTLAAPLPALQVGVPFTAQLQSSPAADFFDSGSLPYGINLDRDTGVLSGTPLEPGNVEVPVWGVNSLGQGGSLTLNLAIASAEGTPVVSNPEVIRVVAGKDLDIQIQSQPAADSFTLSPVPEGLVFDPATGMLTGTLPEGTWVFQVFGTNELGNGIAKTIQLEAYGTASDRWRADNFAGRDPALAAWNASPAGDGIPNLLKYALGLPVFESARHLLPQAKAELHGGERYLTYTIPRDPAATDVQIVPEITTDLRATGWNSGSSFLSVVEDTPSMLKVRDNVPIRQRTRAFIRMKAVAPEP